MPWSRWIEHDGDGAAHDRLVGCHIKTVKMSGEENEGVLTPIGFNQFTAFDWGMCWRAGDDGWRVLRYRVWSDALPDFTVTSIDADRPMEPAEWE